MIYSVKTAAKEYDEYYSTFDSGENELLMGLEKIYSEKENMSSYALKAKNIEYICDNCDLHIFKHSPFFFEFSSGRGRYTWGGLQSKVGLFLSDKTADLWLNAYYKDIEHDLNDGHIQCWNNPVGFDHFSLGYDTILEKGFNGILNDLTVALDKARDEKEKEFLSASARSVKALLRLANRFSKEAYMLAEKADNDAEKEHYIKIAKTAARVPADPPQSFFEAFSSIIFCREAIGSLDGIGVSIYGHLDRMLEKYYLADVKSGKLSFDEVKNLFHIIFTYNDVRFNLKKEFHETSTTIVIGGCHLDGSVCYNDITRAVLDALYEGRYINTKVNCRISSAHPKEYIEKFARIQAADIPTIVLQNDDVIIPARVKCGQSLEDSRSYVSGGCHEIVLQNTEVSTRADTWINLPRLFLDVLEKSTAATFDEFYGEVLKRIKEYLLFIMKTKNKYEAMWSKFSPLPLCSSTVTGCIEGARDITDGGAKYSSTALSLLAPANLVDSLTSVRILVYENKELSLKELYGLCVSDFAENSLLRKRIIDCFPKYGVNNSEIDTFAAKLLHDISLLYRDENGNFYKNSRGGNYLPAFYPHEMFRCLGLKTIATPDGRSAYTSLSRGCSPSEFIKLDSPVGILNSLSKIDFTDYADSFCTEITLQRMDEAKGTEIISALIGVFLQNGGCTLQMNLFDRDMLIEAQKHPEEHRDLCVRVCGYSAVFVTLWEELQNEIISRAIR